MTYYTQFPTKNVALLFRNNICDTIRPKRGKYLTICKKNTFVERSEFAIKTVTGGLNEL